jgi:ferric-dicitrate binding protein FerR (iron transport regulator)
MDEAINWLVRQQDPDFSDWGGFTAWLEESSANAKAYAAIALCDQLVATSELLQLASSRYHATGKGRGRGNDFSAKARLSA